MRTESSGIRVEADLYWSTINCVERSEIGHERSSAGDEVPHTAKPPPFSLHRNDANANHENDNRCTVPQVRRNAQYSTQPEYAPEERLPNRNKNHALSRTAKICPDRSVPSDVARKPIMS